MQTAMAGYMRSGIPTAAPARSDAIIALMTAHLDVMKATSAAGKALYAVLTDAQMEVADDLMMLPMVGM
jgi:hypothetical protein